MLYANCVSETTKVCLSQWNRFILETWVKDHEESKSRLESGNVCYHSVQNLLSSSFLSRNIENKIDGTVILRIILHGSVTLREEHRARVFVNRVLKRIFDRTMDELTKKWKRLRNLELLICCPHQIFLGWSNKEEWDGWGMWYFGGTEEVPTGFWRGGIMERDYLEGLGVNGKIILRDRRCTVRRT
jgi:hypothetical protein